MFLFVPEHYIESPLQKKMKKLKKNGSMGHFKTLYYIQNICFIFKILEISANKNVTSFSLGANKVINLFQLTMAHFEGKISR